MNVRPLRLTELNRHRVPLAGTWAGVVVGASVVVGVVRRGAAVGVAVGVCDKVGVGGEHPPPGKGVAV